MSSTSNGSVEKEDSSIPTALSTMALETKLKTLRDKSNKHSQLLTQKLASSQSGQNLLHIGTSLSTLPPDLHSLLTQLHPVLSATELCEKKHYTQLQDLVQRANQIRIQRRRVQQAQECANLYQDLLAAERDVATPITSSTELTRLCSNNDDDDDEEDSAALDKLDSMSSLERAAHTTLCLLHELEQSTKQIAALTATTNKGTPTDTLPSLRTPLDEDTERAQFFLKLSPRIRRLESNAIAALSNQLEHLFQTLQQPQSKRSWLMLGIGHCMRGLAILGKGSQVENVFARVAIMPLIRSKVSMGRLDEGGSRGECAGLFTLLDDMACSIANTFGSVLGLAESMFVVGANRMEVDLITAGVWVPIATALLADPGIKMAIFSPGIASILQANYMALDTFLAELASRLLADTSNQESSLYFAPSITPQVIAKAQDRIYAHPKTTDFLKKWNLPIYYQLRFGESCNRLNKAVDETQVQGWIAQVFAGSEQTAEHYKQTLGFEISFFLELYDILVGFWAPDVLLRPLTHRFLRGSVQLIGRAVAFVRDGMDGKLLFGQEPVNQPKKDNDDDDDSLDMNGTQSPMYASPARRPYCWGDSEEDVAAVAWELTILETTVSHDYVTTVSQALAGGDSTESEHKELANLASDVLKDAAQQIRPLVDKAWNELVVTILTRKCLGPLGAVKGVAATYRMTNRPPPTQASPFVATILRPLQQFDREFKDRTPHHIGITWKQKIVKTVAEKYSAAVEELIATVQRTEVALKNRKARRMTAGGMSDGEKVKLQLYLDYQEFSRQVESTGLEPSSLHGLAKLKNLTIEAESLLQRKQNGAGTNK